jgi:arylsulfatase A-like enzyme
MIRNSELEYLPGNPGSENIIGPHYTQYLIYEETIKFILENKDKPFFCYCGWTPPHGDFIIPPSDPAWQEFKDEPWPSEDAKKYAAMVKMCDTQIGNIFKMLKDLDLDEKTIVFFSGDNGGARYFDDFFAGNDPFSGKKGNLYEGGLRIPMIARWPGRIAAGVVSDFLWYFPDFFPTFAELAGADVPDHVDGVSILPTLIGEDAAGHPQEIHDYLYWEHKNQVAVRIGNYKGIQPGTGAAWELYDLDFDLPEANNIAALNPGIVAQMQAYAAEAHTEHLIGDVLDASKAYGGHTDGCVPSS